MAFRENANMARQDVAAGSGSAVPPEADSGDLENSQAVGKSAGTADKGMTQNEALFLVNFVKQGFSSLSDRMDRSETAQEKRKEDLAERVGRSGTAQEKSADNLEKRMDRIEERQLKFFIWIMGCFGATVLVLGVPLYLPLLNLG